MPQVNIPYEFLARWDHKTGVLKGAHVKVFATIKDDAGNIVMQQEGDAQPVSIGQATGFPISEIMTALQTGALLAAESAEAALLAEKMAHQATKDTATAIIEELKTQLAAAIAVP